MAVGEGCARPVVIWCVPAFQRPSRAAGPSALPAARPGEGSSGVPGAFVSFSASLDGCFSC